MDIYSLTDEQLVKQMGQRIRALRLRKNTTQASVAKQSGLSLNTIKSLEAGKGKLSSLIAVLRTLQELEHLNQFIPEIKVSPMQLLKLRGKKRERASRKRTKKGES